MHRIWHILEPQLQQSSKLSRVKNIEGMKLFTTTTTCSSLCTQNHQLVNLILTVNPRLSVDSIIKKYIHSLLCLSFSLHPKTPIPSMCTVALDRQLQLCHGGNFLFIWTVGVQIENIYSLGSNLRLLMVWDANSKTNGGLCSFPKKKNILKVSAEHVCME